MIRCYGVGQAVPQTFRYNTRPKHGVGFAAIAGSPATSGALPGPLEKATLERLKFFSDKGDGDYHTRKPDGTMDVSFNISTRSKYAKTVTMADLASGASYIMEINDWTNGPIIWRSKAAGAGMHSPFSVLQNMLTRFCDACDESRTVPAFAQKPVPIDNAMAKIMLAHVEDMVSDKYDGCAILNSTGENVVLILRFDDPIEMTLELPQFKNTYTIDVEFLYGNATLTAATHGKLSDEIKKVHVALKLFNGVMEKFPDRVIPICHDVGPPDVIISPNPPPLKLSKKTIHPFDLDSIDHRLELAEGNPAAADLIDKLYRLDGDQGAQALKLAAKLGIVGDKLALALRQYKTRSGLREALIQADTDPGHPLHKED